MEKSITPTNLADMAAKTQVAPSSAQGRAKQSVATILNGILDSEG